jgi:hypothetical protein
MITLTRGTLAEFFKVSGNHNVSFEVEIPDTHVFVGIRHPAYGQAGDRVLGTPFIALINPLAPDPASKVLTQISDLHSWEEAATFLKVVSIVATQHDQRTSTEWAEFLSTQTGSNVKVSNYGG